MFDAIVQGILLGGYYAMLASGLSLLFGVARFINLAHGDLALLGSYLALTLVRYFDCSPFVACLVMLPVMAALGWWMQTWLFARTVRGGILLPLLTTFGLSAVIQNGLYGVFGSDAASMGNHIGNLSWDNFDAFGLSIGKLPVLTFTVALAALGALQIVLSWTKFGRALRATSQDPEAARMSGVNAEQIQRGAAAIAVALAGLAGVFLAMRSLINPYSGPAELVYAFEAVVIGGMGSLWGTLIGGIVLGIAQCVGATVSPQGFQLAGHLVFLTWLGARLFREGAYGLSLRDRLLKWVSA